MPEGKKTPSTRQSGCWDTKLSLSVSPRPVFFVIFIHLIAESLGLSNFFYKVSSAWPPASSLSLALPHLFLMAVAAQALTHAHTQSHTPTLQVVSSDCQVTWLCVCMCVCAGVRASTPSPMRAARWRRLNACTTLTIPPFHLSNPRKIPSSVFACKKKNSFIKHLFFYCSFAALCIPPTSKGSGKTGEEETGRDVWVVLQEPFKKKKKGRVV